jgi:hypothetical protein
MTPLKTYTSQISKRLGYCASWLPRNQIAVGDIALMENRSLERQKSIRDIGIDIEIREGNEVKDWGWTSGTTFEVNPAISAGAPVHPGVQIGGGLTVGFTRKNGILLRMERSQEQSLERLDSLRKEMLRLHETGEWERDWVVVTQVIHAGRMIVLISERRGASADLTAAMRIGAEPASVIEAEGKIELLGSSGMNLQETGENLTPLYKALRVKPGRIRKSRIKQINRRGRARATEGADVIEVVF